MTPFIFCLTTHACSPTYLPARPIRAHPKREKNWHCALGHNFDLAREGYANLLVVQHKNPKPQAIARNMVDARTRVLESGIYQPISDLINQWVQAASLPLANAQIADIGCGEGYYTERLERSLQAQGTSHVLYAVDIAKEAIKRAAKRSKAFTGWLPLAGACPCKPKGWTSSSICLPTPCPRLSPSAQKRAGLYRLHGRAAPDGIAPTHLR